MRLNLPVLPQEFPFPSGQTLVSSTDLKGRITYCNRAFVLVSGYSHDELMGQPHNLIRHPDMPEEAFRDMWETIAAGQPWSGLVKNRRKDGRCYWVMANVTPLMSGDQPSGYMSVRTEASREQVQAAEALYTTMRAEKEQGGGRLLHTLKAGHLRRNNWRGALTRLGRLGLAGRMRLATGSAALVGLAAGLGLPTLGMGLGAVTTTGLGIVLAFAAALASAAWLNRQVGGPLHQLLRFANRMAAGDLSGKLASQRGDLVGRLERALNQLNVNLRSIVGDARREVESMHAVTREIAAGNTELSARTESQASSLEETASSMEEITGTVRQSAASAQQVSQLAGQATQVTERSSQEVHAVTSTMQEISQSSQRIGEIIQVIDTIAFQTNILALNAAVEAARAGEQGRGFAVVAAEVRSLSQRTSVAAKEIKQLIETSAAQVAAGAKQTQGAQATMDQALDAVRQVGALIEQIHTGANEQLLGISQVNEAVSHMDSITQQNAAMVEELAASASSLTGQAQALAESVRVFHLDSRDTAQQADAVALRRQAKRAVAETPPATTLRRAA